MPCSVFTVPLPTLSGEQMTVSTPSRSNATAGADDIGDGIGGADLVEVDLLDGHLMDCGFGFAESSEDGDGVALRAARRDRAFSIIFTMCERWRCFLVSGTATRNLVAPMPQRFTFSKETDAPASSECDGVGDGGLVGAGIGQRADQHVAANSRECVQIASNGHELLL